MFPHLEVRMDGKIHCFTIIIFVANKISSTMCLRQSFTSDDGTVKFHDY